MRRDMKIASAVRRLRRLAHERVSRSVANVRRTIGRTGRTTTVLRSKGTREVLRGLGGKVKATFPRVPGASLRVGCMPRRVRRRLDPTFCVVPTVSCARRGMVCMGRVRVQSSLTLFAALTRRKCPKRLCRAVFFRDASPSPIEDVLGFNKCMRN